MEKLTDWFETAFDGAVITLPLMTNSGVNLAYTWIFIVSILIAKYVLYQRSISNAVKNIGALRKKSGRPFKITFSKRKVEYEESDSK